MYPEQERYWIWLSQLPGMTSRLFYAIISACGAAEAVWRNPEIARPLMSPEGHARLMAARSDGKLSELFDDMERGGIRALTHLGGDYPEPLRFIDDPPPTLYVRGCADRWMDHSVAVVGSRRATRDGLRAAGDIARVLGENGVTVVSGMARGIDSAAHIGCLEADGRTVAVLGSGVDVSMSHESAELCQRIIGTGGSVVSEYRPGMPPYKSNFPRRNRIISGLSSGVLLVEGEADSGALITLRYANRQNRVRFALPGSIYAANSVAPNALIRDGAVAVLGGEDILRHFGWPIVKRNGPSPKPVALSNDELKMVKLLKQDEMSFDELAGHTVLNSATLNTLLTILEMRGIIKQLPGKLFRANV